MALLSGSSNVADFKEAIYDILYAVEKAFSTGFPEAWYRVSGMDPQDRDYILQQYATWKQTKAARPSASLTGSSNYGTVGAGSFENTTGRSGGAVTSH